MLTHHAYVIEGSLSQFNDYAEHVRTAERFDHSDPNLVVRQFEKFGIDEARALIELSNLKNTGRALFVVGVSSITSEAQQALLKLFEEPQQGTVYVLMLPHGMLLPTLRSRMLPYPERVAAKKGTGEAKEFLASPYKKRSDWIAATLKDEDDAREHVRSFLDELELELYARIGEGKNVRESLEELQRFRQYLSDRAPSLKMILEHFAATLPKY